MNERMHWPTLGLVMAWSAGLTLRWVLLAHPNQDSRADQPSLVEGHYATLGWVILLDSTSRNESDGKTNMLIGWAIHLKLWKCPYMSAWVVPSDSFHDTESNSITQPNVAPCPSTRLSWSAWDDRDWAERVGLTSHVKPAMTRLSQLGLTGHVKPFNHG